MKLFYFTSDNLKNSLFIKEFVSAYHKLEGKAILIHASFGSLQDTRFVTKRISAILSEVMVVNNAISGDQKQIIRQDADGTLQVRKAELEHQLKMVDLLVVNPIASTDQGPALVDSLALVQKLRELFAVDTPILFTRNAKSPLAKTYVPVNTPGDIDPLMEIYEEEKIALENAAALAPALIGSPNLFG